MDLILGSTSPRRGEILNFFSVTFLQIPSQFDEDSIPFEGNPSLYVSTLAEKKAQALSLQYPTSAILTADTTVAAHGKVYNKPKNREEAVQFLSELSDSWHSVFTGLSLSFAGKTHTLCEETKILFHPLSLEQINHYLDKVNFLDKAGSYAIQQGGAILVKKIEGCYYNVMGLPLTSLRTLLLKIDVDLWSHLKII